MEIRAFKYSITGEIPITKNTPLKSNETLRLMLIPKLTEDDFSTGYLEVYNPYDMRVVNANIPEFDNSKIVYFDIETPRNWVTGIYLAVVMNSSKKMVTSCIFYFQTSETSHYIHQTTTPIWEINYSLRVKNISSKPVGNFVAFIALPITIPPQQIVKNLETFPESIKVSTDIEGNHWTKFELKRINPLEERIFNYKAMIETKPIIFSRNLAQIQGNNPYSKSFLKKYLKSEPHIESQHPQIREIASNFSQRDPFEFAKKIAKHIQKILTYEVQPGEYGAAFAIENKRGDCTEYAALFVAICRAAGIPARTNAGFAFSQQWERHATAEFLVAGRWVPIDLTMRQGSEIQFGNLPTSIIVSRGNWMGGTITKEVSYKYQVIEQSQKLTVDIYWKIQPKNKDNYFQTLNKSIKILEPYVIKNNNLQSTIVENKSVKILDLHREQEKIIHIKPKEAKAKNSKELEININLPDAIRKGQTFKPEIVLKNNSNKKLVGCMEIRHQLNEVSRIISLNGNSLLPNTSISLTPKIKVEYPGINSLEFVYINRIGRTLIKKDKEISFY